MTFVLVNPFGLEAWGSTAEEQAAPMVGDDLIAGASLHATRSISIAAAPAEVFPWLRQMGYKRAGWYSYDWIDNLGRESARVIRDEWQGLRAGDQIPAGPMAFEASVVEPNHAFCMAQLSKRVSFTLAFELRPEEGGTRLVSRARAVLNMPLGALLTTAFLTPGDGLMVRRHFPGIKERAEALAS